MIHEPRRTHGLHLGLYRLLGHEPVECHDLLEWGTAFENLGTRQVAETWIEEGVRVSTVFLGIDYNPTGVGPPMLFGSLVFGGPTDGQMARYASWHEAEACHEAMVAWVKRELAHPRRPPSKLHPLVQLDERLRREAKEGCDGS